VRYRLIVVEGASTPADASVVSALAGDGDFDCRILPWEALGRETLDLRDAHALVAVGVPSTVTITAGLERLRDQRVRAPTLAILPPEVDAPLMRLAREATDDFLLSPVRPSELRERLGRMTGFGGEEDLSDVRERLLTEFGMTRLVGADPAFLAVVHQMPRLARFDAPVLITGETGTGKELCARAIHFFSKRRDMPFVAVDCAVLPDHLLENELFGHSRGAYTDAHRDQRGLVAMAEGGTLFLDEIDALSVTAQGKLLRFLADGTFRPLGADRFQRANVRVVTATNKDVQVAVRADQFRADLLYRLNVLRLHLPPLRQRRSDIAVLAAHFLRECRKDGGEVAPRAFSAAALRVLSYHDWPGNIRELQNVVHRAFVSCEGRRILPSHLTLAGVTDSSPAASGQFRSARAAVVAAFERQYVEELLRKNNGNVTRAARDANKERRAFGRLMKKHGIDRRALQSAGCFPEKIDTHGITSR
jgi:DNA-binding NtrC family response regulator